LKPGFSLARSSLQSNAPASRDIVARTTTTDETQTLFDETILDTATQLTALGNMPDRSGQVSDISN
jgi:hypothetical protein